MTPRKNPKDRLKTGRPSDYRHDFCEQLIEHRREGKSYETFAGVVGVSIATLYNWEKANPEFLEAKQKAEPLALAKWEDIVMNGAVGKYGKFFSAAVCIYTLKNRFPKYYNDKPATDETDELTIKIDVDERGL